jgi:hypothetical protein
MKQKDLKQSASNVSHEVGAAIRGEKVTAQFRTMYGHTVLAGSSTHKIQQTKLEGSVFCVIDKPLNFLRNLQSK